MEFTIATEVTDISYEYFKEKYFDTETPVLIKGLALNWPAIKKWNRNYLNEQFAKDGSARSVGVYSTSRLNFLEEDIITPVIIKNILNNKEDIFQEQEHLLRTLCC